MKKWENIYKCNGKIFIETSLESRAWHIDSVKSTKLSNIDCKSEKKKHCNNVGLGVSQTPRYLYN